MMPQKDDPWPGGWPPIKGVYRIRWYDSEGVEHVKYIDRIAIERAIKEPQTGVEKR